MGRALRVVIEKTLAVAAVICALVQAGSAREPGAVELGLDGAVSGVWIGENPVGRVAVEMPQKNLRAGVFLTDFIQVEPAVSFALASTKVKIPQQPGVESEREDRTTNYTIEFGVALAGHLSADWGSQVPFLRLEPTLLVLAQEDPEFQFALEAGAGVKLPVGKSWAGRIELDVLKSFEREGRILGAWAATLRFGLSYFTQ